jgi:hypothetical protein
MAVPVPSSSSAGAARTGAPGFASWVSIGSVPPFSSSSDYNRPSIAPPPFSDAFITEQLPPAFSTDRQNYFVRHWRGSLPLATAFWFNGILGYVCVAIGSALLMAYVSAGDRLSPFALLVGTFFIWCLPLVTLTWQVVGAWRSASNIPAETPRQYIGGLCKLALILCVLHALGTLAYNGIPQLRETYKIATGDPDVGEHTFRILRDGRELEFSGGISFRVADELKRFLDAMGSIKVIHDTS